MGAQENHNASQHTPAGAAVWTRAVHALQRAWHGCSLYGAEHPAVIEAAQSAARELAQATQHGGGVLGVTAEGFLLDGEPLSAPESAGERLAHHLHQAGIAAIEVTAAAASAEVVHAFAIALGEADRAHLSADKLADYIKDRTDGRLSLLPLSFAPLKIATGQRTTGYDRQSPASSRQPDWTDLVSALLTPTDDASASAPPGLRLALDFDRDVADQPQSAVGEWRDRLRGLADQFPTLSDDQQQTVGRHLRGFVGRLSDGLRQALLRVDRTHPQTSLRLLDEVAQSVPVAQVLDALHNLDQIQGQPSKEALRLCRKLANVSAAGPEDQDRIVATLQRWQSSPDLPADTSAQLQQSLQEIMQTRSDVDFSPQPYHAQLDRLSEKVEPSQVAGHLPDHLDSHEAKLHAAAVAAEIALATPAGELDGPGLFEHLCGTLDRMIIDGRADQIVNAFQAASTHATGPADDQTADAARRLLQSVSDEERVGRLLETAAGRDGDPEQLLRTVVTHGGPAALRSIARQFAAQPNGPWRRLLAQAVSDCPHQTFQAAVHAMVASRDPALASTIELTAQMPARRAAAVLVPLAQSAPPSVRAAALAALHRVDADWPDELALAALRDDETSIQLLAVEHLATRDEERPLDMIAAFIAGRIGGALPGEAAFDAAVHALLDRPQLGLPRLAAALRSLCGTLRPSRVARARRLVRCLRRRASDRDIRRALIRWRLSPASWVALLLPREPWPAEAAA